MSKYEFEMHLESESLFGSIEYDAYTIRGENILKIWPESLVVTKLIIDNGQPVYDQPGYNYTNGVAANPGKDIGAPGRIFILGYGKKKFLSLLKEEIKDKVIYNPYTGDEV